MGKNATGEMVVALDDPRLGKEGIEMNPEAEKKIDTEIDAIVETELAETKEEIVKTADLLLEEKRLTGKAAIIEVLERAGVDTDFMAQLAENPQEALSNYGLNWEEKAALSSGDINQIEKWVGKLTSRQSQWLWARLQQERW